MAFLSRLLVACFFVAFTAATVHADDLFSLQTTGGSTNVNATGSSLINLVENLSDNKNQFSPLKNQTFNASLNYAGISNAFQFKQSFDSSGNRQINFQVPSVGLNETFNAANGDLNRQIRDYLKKDGLADLTAFQAVVDRQSLAGVVDGNPMAATTMLQDAGYQEFAMHESPFALNGKAFATDGGHLVNRYWAEGGVLDAGGVSGQYVDLNIATEIHFNDFIGLTFTTPLRYVKLRSADVFMGGEIVGVPLTIIPAKGGVVSWQITPAGHVAMVGSQDFVSGGLLYGGQVSSQFSLNFNSLTFTVADQAGYYHGADISIGGYDFNTRLNQVIFKNGVQVSKSFGNFFVDASASWTNFTRDVYVNGYFTPEIGVGFKFGYHDSCGLRVGYTGNFGNRYNTNGGNIMLYFGR